MPNHVGLDYTEHTPEGLSACRSSQHPMFFRLRRYEEYFADSPCRAWLCYYLGPYQSASCAPGLFLLVSCCGNDNWGLPGKMSPCLPTRLLHCEPSWLSLFTAITSKTGSLLSVSPDNHWMYHNVITVAVSLVLGVAASKDVRSSLGPICICERPRRLQLCPPHTGHYPTPQLQHRRPAPIGKTAVSDGLSLCSSFITGHLRAVNVNSKVNCSRLAPSVARQPVYSAIATVLVYIVAVGGKITRPALPLSSHCTPRAVSAASLIAFPPTAIPAYPECPRSRRSFRLFTQRLKSRHRTGSSQSTFSLHTKLMA
jgi:hypothetical protein